MRFHQPPFRLKEIKIEVTHRCPLACVHCSSDATPVCNREMEEADCLRVLAEAAAMCVETVAFSGGEPLIWAPINRCLAGASEAGLQVSVYTCGNFPEQGAVMRSLKTCGVRKVMFSLFGAREVIHERITRITGSFGLTLAAISAARDAGLACEIHFVPITDNYQELAGIAEIAMQSGAERVSVLRFVPQGRGHLIKKHALSRLQNLQLKRAIEELRRNGVEVRTGSPYNFLLLNDQPECSSAIDRLIIGPSLNVYPCDAFKQVEAEELVGTDAYSCLAQCSLQDCWDKSPYLKAVREYLTTPFGKPCDTCDVLEQCLSGCLAQKVLTHGDLGKRPDPMCLRRKEVAP